MHFYVYWTVGATSTGIVKAIDAVDDDDIHWPHDTGTTSVPRPKAQNRNMRYIMFQPTTAAGRLTMEGLGRPLSLTPNGGLDKHVYRS